MLTAKSDNNTGLTFTTLLQILMSLIYIVNDFIVRVLFVMLTLLLSFFSNLPRAGYKAKTQEKVTQGEGQSL